LHRVAVEHHFGEPGLAKRKPESVKHVERSEGQASDSDPDLAAAQRSRLANGLVGECRVRERRGSGIEEVFARFAHFPI
jgi:hypothetical protein